MKKESGGSYLWLVLLVFLLVVVAGVVYWFRIPLPWMDETATEAAPVSSAQHKMVSDLPVSQEMNEDQLLKEIQRREQELTRAQQDYKQATGDMETLKQLINDTDQSIKEREDEIQRLKKSKPVKP